MDPRFKIHTGLLKAYEGPDKRKRFHTTASSTIRDLAGDEITPEAIEKMATKANNNLTIYLNHEYRVPEDVLGSVEQASMHTRGVDSEGNPIIDLDFDIVVNDANPRATQTWDTISNGTKLGTSIGAMVKDYKKRKGGGIVIHDVELLEASIVGIPANPRSWVQYAVKSLTDGGFVADDEEPPVEKEIEPEIEAELEPDKEAARTQVTVTVDSDGAQDAPKSTPENALADEDRADTTTDEATAVLGDTTRDVDPDVTTEAEPEVEKDVEEDAVEFDTSNLAALVKSLDEYVEKLTATRTELEEERAKRAEAEENFRVAKEIVERIADLPIGRKVTHQKAVGEFRARFPQYDPEVLKFLEK